MFGTRVTSVDGWALASGSLLRGVYAQQICDAVLHLGEDADRQFAPRPAEVRAIIVRRTPSLCLCLWPLVGPRSRCVLRDGDGGQRDRVVSGDAVVREVEQVLIEKRLQGAEVTRLIARNSTGLGRC